MGAPSDLHEDRVAELRSLGFLSGHTVDFSLGRWLRPDVALRDPNRLRLFVADAKATEHAECIATRSRLRSYASALVPWRRAGFNVRIAVAVQASDRLSWAQLIDDLAPGTGAESNWIDLTDAHSVVWLDLPETVGSRRYPSPYDEPTHRSRHVLRRGWAVGGSASGRI